MTEITMDSVREVFQAAAVEHGKEVSFQESTGDLHVHMSDENNAYLWTVRHHRGNWSLEFDTLDMLATYVGTDLEILAGAD